jgi:hypothetical protein
MNQPTLTEPRHLRGRPLARHLLHLQKKWIEYCEGNDRSYTGPFGDLIRHADQMELERLERLAGR